MNLLPEAQQKNKMSIQSIQVFKKQALVSRKGKKFAIVDFEDVKQFWFQEDIWEHIKSYIISNRSRWLYAMRNTRLSDVYTLLHGLYYRFNVSDETIVGSQTLLTGLEKLYKHPKISNFEKMKKMKKQIIRNIQRRPDYQNLFKDGVQVHSGVSLTDFRVNEEVLFFMDYSIDDRISVMGYRKGVVRRINEKSLRIDLFNYETKTEGRIEKGDSLRWLDTIDTYTLVSTSQLFRIRRKGFIYDGKLDIPKSFDNQFEIGEIDAVITNDSLL